MWNCIGKEKSPYGGHIYEFVAREEYNDFTQQQDMRSIMERTFKKKKEIFPAIEPSSGELWVLCKNKEALDIYLSTFPDRRIGLLRSSGKIDESEERSIEKFHRDDSNVEGVREGMDIAWNQNQKRRDALEELGYQVILDKNQHLHLKLPDLQALRNGWKHFREIHQEIQFPDLDIVESEGIADDLAYADAYRDHDALLSTGKEFVHDHISHIMSRLTLMIKEGAENYDEEKKHINNLIANIRSMIDEAEKKEEMDGIIHKEKEKLNFIVGMLTDAYFSIDVKISDFINLESVEKELSSTEWNSYLAKRFGPETNCKTISELWKKVRSSV